MRQAELAIARLAFRLPGMVTNELKTFEEGLDEKGYDIDLRYLVRCLTVVATGQSRFRALATADPKAIGSAWKETRKAIEYFLNLARGKLGAGVMGLGEIKQRANRAGCIPGPSALLGRG